jgi:DNA-binding FadR family transcriptional regulator
VAVHRAIAQAIVEKSPQGAREAMRIAIAEGFARAAGRMEGLGAEA